MLIGVVMESRSAREEAEIGRYVIDVRSDKVQSEEDVCVEVEVFLRATRR